MNQYNRSKNKRSLQLSEKFEREIKSVRGKP